MSGKLEAMVGIVAMGAMFIGLELFAVWYITGSMPWNL